MSNWSHYQSRLVRLPDLGVSLDFSLLQEYPEAGGPEGAVARAFADMEALEAGAVANPDEGRRVGHYWLRAPQLAPEDIREDIEQALAAVREFSQAVHEGSVAAPGGGKFTRVLLIGIGGSALGPQLVADALTGPEAPLTISFFDNTDPDGMARTLAEIGDDLATTLCLVVSKSGGTAETRNGMLEAEAAFSRAGLSFARHSVAVTCPGSKLDRHAEFEGWLQTLPMADWIGGRTSVMSVVGLLPAALLGLDIDAFLDGAAKMDSATRSRDAQGNAAMRLALAWHAAGSGKGLRDMVVLPYRDRLVLFSKYLQQLVMESLGKEEDLKGRKVHQGIAVYGNKGSTDQHAYVQQLRDGIDNFFVTFIEVRRAGATSGIEVEPGTTSADYLQGFLRGTRSALKASGRQSITLSVEDVDARSLGALIALFERAVSFYASLVEINAYHQPGVEAGKKAAGGFLRLLSQVRVELAGRAGTPLTADDVADSLGADPEDVFHALTHIAAQDGNVSCEPGRVPSEDAFTRAPE